MDCLLRLPHCLALQEHQLLPVKVDFLERLAGQGLALLGPGELKAPIQPWELVGHREPGLQEHQR